MQRSLHDLEEEHVGADMSVLSYSRNLVTLIFSKSAVYIHPTPRSKDNIAGFLRYFSALAPLGLQIADIVLVYRVDLHRPPGIKRLLNYCSPGFPQAFSETNSISIP